MPRLIALLAGILCLCARAQISPGPLSKAHAEWNGPAGCPACHVFGSGTPRLKCLSCHTEIRQRLKDHAGFHARAEDCARCHAEHVGQDANIVRWDTPVDQFDHRQTGYPLQGKHAGLACARCHKVENIPPAARGSIRMHDLRRTYLGLSTQCSTCHADEHRGQLGLQCARCHSVQSWKPAAGFEHRTARFLLTGLHQKAACGACHHTVQQDGHPVIQFRGVSFQTCDACHKDPHRGAFHGACESCHNTTNWKQVSLETAFDHSRTAFPLRDAHAKTGCFQCHRNSNFKAPVAHTLCSDCHTPDPHGGQFARQDCDACHNEATFKPSSFTVARHQKTAYPLTGKHFAVPCGQCHLPVGKATLYRVKFDACSACHRDAHAGQFAARPWLNRCDACHTVETFRPSTFTLAKHKETRFPLMDSHVATPCSGCHQAPAGSYPLGPLRYHFASVACETCHRDPHEAGFTSMPKPVCEACHSEGSWKDLRPFDHGQTNFMLSGAHRTVACAECHRPNQAATQRTVLFRTAAVACAGCHEDIHGGQFEREEGGCNSCHTEVTWKPSIFDHEKRSHFSLKGAHEAVPCRDCHTQTSHVRERAVVLYRSAPTACSDCHSAR